MADNATIGITVSAEGGEAAAAEVQKLTEAISGAGDMLGVYGEQAQAVTESTAGMASGFEHVGLHVFGHQLFELAGITGETRPLIMGMSLAIRQLAESFSIAAGPVALAAVALSALFAALRSTNEESEKAATKATGLYQGYQDAARSLDEYAKAGGHLSTVMLTLRDLENERAAAALKAITAATMEKVHVEELALAHARETQAYLQRSAARHGDTLGIAGAAAETKKHRDALHELLAQLEANQHGFATHKEFVEASTRSLNDHKAAVEENTRALEKEDADWMKSMNEKARGYKEQVDWQIRVQNENKKEAGELSALGQVYASTFSLANASVSGALAKMVVEHKSWAESFKGIMQQVEEQFISMVAQMMIKWLAFEALTAGFGFGVPGVNSLLGTGFAGADGGDMVVSRPTLFMAGEAGPERVSMTPMSGGAPAGGGGGGGSTVVNVTVQAAGVVTDIQAFASQVGEQIARQIRGAGQINFVRAT